MKWFEDNISIFSSPTIRLLVGTIGITVGIIVWVATLLGINGSESHLGITKFMVIIFAGLLGLNVLPETFGKKDK
jgi:hypothetical protein